MSSPEGGDHPEMADIPDVAFDVKERAMDEAPVGITISDPDRPDNPLIYVNDAFERLTGYTREETLGRNCRFLQGEETDPAAVAELARAIDAEETVSVELRNYRKNGEQFWNQVKVAPLENAAGEVTHYIGFQMDVTERKRAELAVRRERANLEHLLDRIDGVLGDVTQEVVSANSRNDIERRVCDRLVEATPYSFAWIGEVDLADDVLCANTWSGDHDVVAADLTVDLAASTQPEIRALETGEIQIVDGTANGTSGDHGTIAAVPLAYRDTTYGVLTVYTPDSDALNEHEAAVLEALGRIIATAMNAHETKRILSASNVAEVELSVRDEALFFVDLSKQVECTLDYRGTVYRDETPLVFFTTDADPNDVCDVAETVAGIEAVNVVGANLLEFRLAGESIVSRLADRGAKVQTITATGGEGRIEIELPASTDVRALLEPIQDRYPGTEIVRYHETQRPPTTEAEFIETLEAELTDRQLAAVQRAYFSGYYDSTRTVTGDELAESMDISRATFHQHLRAAERKLLAAFFDR